MQFIVSISDPRLDTNVFDHPGLPQLDPSTLLPVSAKSEKEKEDDKGGMQLNYYYLIMFTVLVTMLMWNFLIVEMSKFKQKKVAASTMLNYDLWTIVSRKMNIFKN